MSGNDFLQYMAIIGYLGVFYRAFFTLSTEFNENDQVVKQPFAYAVSTSITFINFKGNEWKAFKALIAATKFHEYCQRYSFLIFPRDAKIILVIATLFFMVAFIETASGDDTVRKVIGIIASSTSLFWLLIIERAKNLKKNITILKI